MFDWTKYNEVRRKKDNKTTFILFALWLVYTVCLGVALATVESQLLLFIGFAGYLLSSVGIAVLGFKHSSANLHYYNYKMLHECIDEFVKEKGVEKEWKEFASPNVPEA